MQRKALFVLILSLLCLLLGSCGASSTPSIASTEVTSLYVSRTNSIPQNHVPPFIPQTATNRREVQQFYTFLYTLPAAPQTSNGAIINCLSGNLTYHLRFLHNTSAVFTVNAADGSCASLALGQNDQRLMTDEFWDRLAQVLHVTRQALLPIEGMK